RRQASVVLLRAGHGVLRCGRNHGPGNRQAVGDLPQRPLLGPLLQPLPQRPPRPRAGLVPAGPMAASSASASHERHQPYALTLAGSPSISIAALRPLMPMTLPPGWVQAPQRKTPGI